MLLNCSDFVKMLYEDVEHRNTCATPSCLTCAIFALFNTVREKGTGDPSLIVHIWNGMQSKTFFFSLHCLLSFSVNFCMNSCCRFVKICSKYAARSI